MIPISLRVEDREVLIVGAGQVAARKAANFLEAGARLTFVAPQAHDTIEAWVKADKARLLARRFDPGDLEGRWIAIAATDDVAVNDAVVRAARDAGVLVCVSGAASEPGDFELSAVLRRGGLTVSVSSGVPALSARVRDHIASSLEPSMGRAATLLSAVRGEVNSHLEPDARSSTWRHLVAALPEATVSRERAREWLSAVLDDESLEKVLSAVEWDG